MKKKLDTLIDDIYKVVGKLGEGKPLKITEQQYESFGKFMEHALRDWATPRAARKFTLRMSNIGKPSRQLWYDMHSDRTSSGVPAPTMIKFLYGHILERLVLFLVEIAGHKVTDEQKEIKIDGIMGHMDCKIDGEVIDIKSASGYGFKKFKTGTLPEDDSFGYMAQLAGYETAEGSEAGGFLAINKETGELCLFLPEELDKPNIRTRIKKVKSALNEKNPPELCYAPVADGSSGNFKLARECTYCPHKFECHKDANDGQGLRAFNYAKGPVFLTTVKREPQVEEITHELQV